MKINQTTTQIAFLMLMLHIISRGMYAVLQIMQINISSSISYFLLFVAELTYILVIVYLASILLFVRERMTAIGMFLFLITGIISFLMPFAYQNSWLPADSIIYTSSIPGIITIILLIFMLATSFKLDPSSLGFSFRVFFITVIITGLLRMSLPWILMTVFNISSYKSVLYLSIISIIPAFTIFFIIQKVALMLSNDK